MIVRNNVECFAAPYPCLNIEPVIEREKIAVDRFERPLEPMRQTGAWNAEQANVLYWAGSHRELTRLIPRDARTLFVSTGMQTPHDESYLPRTGVRLHCVSAYPCPPYEANLGAIERGQGYSDHTRCVFTGAFAVSAGADYLEVHYRLADTPASCPDYVVSLDPDGLQKYIGLAREAYRMRGMAGRCLS